MTYSGHAAGRPRAYEMSGAQRGAVPRPAWSTVAAEPAGRSGDRMRPYQPRREPPASAADPAAWEPSYEDFGPAAADEPVLPHDPARARRLVNGSIGLVSLAFVVGLGIWGYGQVKRDVSGVPVVRALAGPIRVTPDDPGGQVAAHTGLAVNAVKAGGAAEPTPDRIVLAPVPPALAEEDVSFAALEEEEGAADAAAAQPGVSVADAATDAGTAPLAGGTETAFGTESAVDDGADETIARALALADEMSAGAVPLSAVTEAAPEVVPPSDADGEFLAEEADALAEEAAPGTDVATGPGLPRSPRPAPRPAGLSAAPVSDAGESGISPSQVEAAVAAALETSAGGLREVDDVAVGTRLVQLGAFDSPEDARAAWAQIDGLVDGLMDDKVRVIQQSEAGGRTFWRLRAMGFDDLSDARRFCAALVAERADCIPVVAR